MRLLFIFIVSLNLFAESDLYYEIHIESLDAILTNKLEEVERTPYCKVYSYRGKLAVEVESNNQTIKEMLKKVCEKKHNIVQGSKLDDLLLNFEFKEKYSKYNVYVDKTGISEVNEIWILENKKQIEIIEKRSIGTTRIKYELKNKKIYKATISSFEGAQSVESDHVFLYSKEKKSDYPTKVVSNYTQKLSKRDIGDFQRKFNETVRFKNYKIDKNIALNYFNKN